VTHTGNPNTTSREPTVLIEGQPAVIAGRSSDDSNTALVSGEPTVLIADHPAATLDGQVVGVSRSVSGRPTVLIAGHPATED